MCEQCGCAVAPEVVHVSEHEHGGAVSARPIHSRSVEILTGILSENDHEAAYNRQHLDAHGILAVNLMSSPGSGKTSLLEATIDAIGDRFRIAVIEGDLETENDAKRIRAKGVPAIQITTGSSCHLDAHMVHDALHALDLSVETSCSSKMSAIWFVRRASISASMPTSRFSPSPKVMTNRQNIP